LKIDMRIRLVSAALAFLVAAAALSAGAAIAAAPGKRTPSPDGAELYFHSPLDGTTVPRRIVVRIGLRNMGVAPAGIAIPNTGHHHLLIDTELRSSDEPIPSDYNHLHLGNGQTEIRVTLPPGRHTLQLLLADYNHVPHDPPVMSRRITVFVKDQDAMVNK
jgi:Domain of unknown function (DUF4399)